MTPQDPPRVPLLSPRDAAAMTPIPQPPDAASPEEILRQGAAALNIPLTEDAVKASLRYLDRLMDANTRMNLTAVRDPCEAVVKHFLDAFTLLPLLPDTPGLSLADVGTGAGFPGLALKLVRLDLRLLLLDSVAKRLAFLEDVRDDLGLTDVTTLHARAEDAGHDPLRRERHDVVTARAVAELRTLAELCLPLVKPGGLFLAMKGPRGAEEREAAGNALRRLGGEVEAVHALRLPYLEEAREIVVIRKVRPTPSRYPRRPADLRRDPL